MIVPLDTALPVVLLTVLLLVVGSVTCLPLSRLTVRRDVLAARGRDIAPYAGLLTVVLVLNKAAIETTRGLAWLLHWDITPTIYAVEGLTVARVQALIPGEAVVYFSFVYVVGYVFLLVFPVVAYFLTGALRLLKLTFLSYALNYALGVVCYTLTIAYGPRNYIPDHVGQPMYATYPEVIFITSSMNANTNVFPSLHTSLSVTVILLALLSRRRIPRWVPVAVVLGTSVTLATMYLGIHWLTDVVAGVVLAVVCVSLAVRLLDRVERRPERSRLSLRRALLENR